MTKTDAKIRAPIAKPSTWKPAVGLAYRLSITPATAMPTAVPTPMNAEDRAIVVPLNSGTCSIVKLVNAANEAPPKIEAVQRKATRVHKPGTK